MKEIKIAVGTTNENKISGIKIAVEGLKSDQIITELNEYQEKIWNIIKNHFQKEIIISTHKTESLINDMPTTLEETILGAKNRTMDLIKSNIDADYYVGTEGGTCNILDKTLLYSTVCIISSFGTLHIGTSNGIELPRNLAKKVKSGTDLSKAFIEEYGVIPKIGSISGALSLNTFSREEQFKTAFKSAMIPFCNNKLY